MQARSSPRTTAARGHRSSALGGVGTRRPSARSPPPVADAAVAGHSCQPGQPSTTNIITQITTTAQDASFNGINLLNGDDLKLVFNETGKSTLTITGVTFNAGRSRPEAALVAGTDFMDNASANAALTALNTASITLRSQASAFGAEPVDRADPPGLQQEPDQRAADRFGQPDARRYQRGSGQQPGAVDPPVDRGLGAGAGQPVAASVLQLLR